MKKSTKLLVLLLSVALIVAGLVVVIGANGDAYGYNGGSAATLDEAFAASSDGKVTLLGDIEISEPLAIPVGKTLDLGGYTITNTADTAVFELSGSVVGQGHIVSAGPIADAADGAVIAGSGYGIHATSDAETLFNVSGSFEASLLEVTASENLFDAFVLDEGAVFNATNVNFIAECGNAFVGVGASISVDGGSFVGFDSFFLAESEETAITLNSVIVKATYEIFFSEYENAVTLTDTALELTGATGDAYAVFCGVEATVTGGSVKAGNGVDIDGATVTYGEGVYIDNLETEANLISGTKIYRNPAAVYGCLGVVSAKAPLQSYVIDYDFEDSASEIGTAYTTYQHGYMRPGVYAGWFTYANDNGSIVHEYHLPTFTDEDGDGNYEVTTGTKTAKSGTSVRVESSYNPVTDEVTYTRIIDSNSPQIYYQIFGTQLQTGLKGTEKQFDVVVYEFDLAYGGGSLIDFAIYTIVHNSGIGSGTGFGPSFTVKDGVATYGSGDAAKVINLNTDGSYNNFKYVIDNASRKGYFYINGELIFQANGFGESADLDGIRFHILEDTYKADSVLRFDNMEYTVYNDGYLGESFDVNDYLDPANAVIAPKDYVASINGVGYKTLAEATPVAQELGTYISLMRDATFDASAYLGATVYTNGYSVSVDMPSSKDYTLEALENSDGTVAYNFDHWLFSVTHSDESVSNYYNLQDFYDYMTHWVTDTSLYSSNNDVKKAVDAGLTSLFKNGDILKLNGDITYDTTISPRIGGTSVTIDLNGYTIDTSASANYFVALGALSGGSTNGNHNNNGYVTLVIKSSRKGGVIRTSKNYATFNIVGGGKTLTVEGGDMNDPDVTIETLQLVTATTGGSASGGDTRLTFNGGRYVQAAGATKALINLSFGPSAAKPYEGAYVINDAEIELNGTNADSTIVALAASNNYGVGTLTAARNLLTVDGCVIKAAASKTVFSSSLGYSNIVVTNSEISGNVTPAGTAGKVVLGAGTVYTGTPTVTSGSSTAILENSGGAKLYYATSDLMAIKYNYVTGSEAQKYAVGTEADVKSVEYVRADGTSIVLYEDFYKTAILPAPEYTEADKVGTTAKLTHNGWATTSASTATAVQYQPAMEVAYIADFTPYVSTSLYTSLGINLYIPTGYGQHLKAGEGTAFVLGATPEGEAAYVATINIDSNQVFIGATFEIVFEEVVGGETVVSRYETNVNPYTYAAYILADTTGKYDGDKDLMYYMLSYFKAAYAYMDLDADEVAMFAEMGVEAGDVRDTVIELFDDAIGAYVTTADYAPIYEEYTGDELGVGIAVDLKSTPEFVFVLNSAAKSVAVNGVVLETEQRSIGGQDVLVSVYANANIHNFDKNITVTTYDESGAEIATEVVCFANYAFNANESGDAVVKAVVDALYEYILAADAYPGVSAE